MLVLIPSEKELSELRMSGENADIEVFDWKEITFGSKKNKEVAGGEFFTSDPIKLTYEKGEYLCLEMTFSGKRIPYHEETLLPVFIKDGEQWKYSKRMPFAGMIGCDREVKARVAYWGDSITQGIGYGRANDAVSDGAWLYKAKQNDIIFVCYGANDILKGQSEEQIKDDLLYIADTLKKLGKKVIMQTIPPCNCKGENIEKWKRINSYILTELKNKVDLVFDNNGYLGKEGKPEEAKYSVRIFI